MVCMRMIFGKWLDQGRLFDVTRVRDEGARALICDYLRCAGARI
jgi:hypothetical protein